MVVEIVVPYENEGVEFKVGTEEEKSIYVCLNNFPTIETGHSKYVILDKINVDNVAFLSEFDRVFIDDTDTLAERSKPILEVLIALFKNSKNTLYMITIAKSKKDKPHNRLVLKNSKERYLIEKNGKTHIN